MIGPDTSEAIGLKLDPYLNSICFCPIDILLELPYLRQDTQLILDMMSDFVSYHVCLRKLARLCGSIASMKAPLEILEEGRIKVKLLVVRAIERTSCRLSEPTA